MKTEYERLVEAIRKREALDAERAALQAELEPNAEAISRLRSEAEGLRYRRSEMHDLVKRQGSSEPDEHRDIRAIDKEIARNKRAAEAADAENQRLHERLRAVDAEKMALRAGSRKAVLDHQAELEKSAQEVEKLETLLAEHRARVDAARRFDDPLPALEEQREALLAAIAASEPKEAELKRLDTEIEQASERTTEHVTKAEATVDRSGGTLRGLEKRLVAAHADHDGLAALTPLIQSFFLRTEAEAAGKEYKRHAERLVKSFERFTGLAQILERIDREAGAQLGWRRGQDLHLPLFNLDVFEGALAKNHAAALFDARHGTYLQASRAAEAQRLRDQGIELP